MLKNFKIYVARKSNVLRPENLTVFEINNSKLTVFEIQQFSSLAQFLKNIS